MNCEPEFIVEASEGEQESVSAFVLNLISWNLELNRHILRIKERRCGGHFA